MDLIRVMMTYITTYAVITYAIITYVEYYGIVNHILQLLVIG